MKLITLVSGGILYVLKENKAFYEPLSNEYDYINVAEIRPTKRPDTLRVKIGRKMYRLQSGVLYDPKSSYVFVEKVK